MFFIHLLEHTITLHPSFFGSKINWILTRQLHDDVEGTTTGNYYIVCVMDVADISSGRVMPGSGRAEYTLSYRAIVWKPYKGECLDGTVSKVVSNGFFVDIGPLTAFVSAQSMPPRMRYDANATPPAFVENTESGLIEVTSNTRVRVRIRGIRAEVGQMWAIATINDDYLGPLEADEGV